MASGCDKLYTGGTQMKLRNKKTDEIIDFDSITDLCFGKKIQLQATNIHNKPIYIYNSLAELNAVWEDYEEPSCAWIISRYTIEKLHRDLTPICEGCKTIGNYFETKEEAEKAVEKLKAWKRLKDGGLKIREYELSGGTDSNGSFTGNICLTLDITKPVYEDVIQLLFGGEE
jgi:hypothetical protein